MPLARQNIYQIFCYLKTRSYVPEDIFLPRYIVVSENAGISEAGGQSGRGRNIMFFVYPSELKGFCPNIDVTSLCTVPCIRRNNRNGSVVRVNY
jgi:hypothetical protein